MRGDDEHFMTRALELARSAPSTWPNPRVGAVIVNDGRVVGEGRHDGVGSPHAEISALEGADAAGATVYVNLEPCNHQGRTPPCAPALVDAGVVRVVASHEDPDPRVRGSGFAFLRAHGVAVTEGVGRDAAARLNAPFLHHHRTGLPLLTLKLALSVDGRLAARDGSARWITGRDTRARVHRRRLEADAVMVGAGTVLADDPLLTARPGGAIDASRQPLRIVVDAAGRVPAGARVLAGPGDVLVATTARSTHEVQTSWKEAGAEVAILPDSATGVDLGALLALLGERPVLDVVCEGGARLATSLLAGGLVDRLECHFGPLVLGEGGPAIGDLGIRGMSDARRWICVEVARSGADAVVVLEPEA